MEDKIMEAEVMVGLLITATWRTMGSSLLVLPFHSKCTGENQGKVIPAPKSADRARWVAFGTSGQPPSSHGASCNSPAPPVCELYQTAALPYDGER